MNLLKLSANGKMIKLSSDQPRITKVPLAVRIRKQVLPSFRSRVMHTDQLYG